MQIPTRQKVTRNRIVRGGNETTSTHAHNIETPFVSEVIGLGSKRSRSNSKKRQYRSARHILTDRKHYETESDSEASSSESNVDEYSSDDDTSSQDSTSRTDGEFEQPTENDEAPSSDDINTDNDEDDVASACRTVIYFRPRARISHEKRSAITKVLSADYPDASIVLESVNNITKAPYSSRSSLNRLMNRVFDQTVDQILVADSNHICSTKDAFQLFCWVCDTFGTKVLVSPGLQLP